MNKILMLIPALMLVGCTATPVKRTFPEPIPEVMQACPELKEAEKSPELSKMLDTVVQNYGSYYECRAKMEAWIKWYTEQKKNFDTVK